MVFLTTTTRSCMILRRMACTRNSRQASDDRIALLADFQARTRARLEKPDPPLQPRHTPAVIKLFRKPYAKWTKKEKAWLDSYFQKLTLKRESPRGRKSKDTYADLYYDIEMSKLSGKPLTYMEHASRYFDLRESDFKDAPRKTNIPRARYKRHQLIRAYQRRRDSLRLPIPPQK
jgi:hypothetical protein